MGTQSKLNVIGLLSGAIFILFSFFLWASNRWIDKVEAQSEDLTVRQQHLTLETQDLRAALHSLEEQLRSIDNRTQRIEESVSAAWMRSKTGTKP